jgi:hypothetical protein
MQKGDDMVRTYRTLLALFLVGIVVCGTVSLATAADEPQPSGSIHMTATSVAIGIGWSWGKGTLTMLDGSEYNFKIDGLDVVAVGAKQSTFVGKVYNLKKVEDFAGTYTKATAGIAVGAGADVATMTNQNGVQITLRGTAAGIDVRLAASGMEIKLQK